MTSNTIDKIAASMDKAYLENKNKFGLDKPHGAIKQMNVIRANAVLTTLAANLDEGALEAAYSVDCILPEKETADAIQAYLTALQKHKPNTGEL